MDLPIKVLSRNEVQIYGLLTKRSTLEEILRMMDEFEEESSSFISPSCLSKNHHICEQEGCTCGCHGEPAKWEPGMKAICYSSHHVNPVEFEIRKVVETPGFSHGPVLYAVDPLGSSHDSINCKPVPPPKEQPKIEPYRMPTFEKKPRFSGPHWDSLNSTMKHGRPNNLALCVADIRDALLEKEEK